MEQYFALLIVVDIIGAMTNLFYFQLDAKGSRIPYKFIAGEKKEYEDICVTIWMCIPFDLDWAMNTQPYKAEKKRRENAEV